MGYSDLLLLYTFSPDTYKHYKNTQRHVILPILLPVKRKKPIQEVDQQSN